MTSKITPVILCGGSGTRLWPESRGARAKQFLPLTDPRFSLFQDTLERTPMGARFTAPLIICGQAHVADVRAQAGEDFAGTLLVEPVARNTAAAIALAVTHAEADALLLVMPSDHVIADRAAFIAAIEVAAELARQDHLVTFGIEPDRPDTGFGYIASGARLGPRAFAVDRFVEKPPLEDAKAMLAEGNYSWNAGIFLFRAGRMASALVAHCPAILHAAEQALRGAAVDGDALYADAECFATAPSEPIDRAVMEVDDRVAVVPVSMGWSDLGSWHAVQQLSARDEGGNALRGDVFVHDSRGNLVRAGDKRVSIIGLEQMAVIVDGDDILVMPLDRSQDVREAAKHRG